MGTEHGWMLDAKMVCRLPKQHVAEERIPGMGGKDPFDRPTVAEIAMAQGFDDKMRTAMDFPGHSPAVGHDSPLCAEGGGVAIKGVTDSIAQ